MRHLLWLTVLAFPAALLSQTCTITSPTSGQLIQIPEPFQLTATVSSAPSAYKLIWTVDYQRWTAAFVRDPHPPINTYRDEWKGAFATTWYTGLNGDGSHTVSGVVYDIFGNALAACPTVSFTVRTEGMSNQSFNTSIPTSGKSGSVGFLTFDGTFSTQASLDGVPFNSNQSGSCQSYPLWSGETGGWIINNFNTTCWPNGTHLLVGGYSIGLIQDPYVLNKTFTSSNVSGNNITVADHYSQQGSVVTFTTTGTLPAPLVAGSQWYWKTTPTNPSNTITTSISGGVMTFTCSSNCGATAGTPVFIRNIQSTNQVTGQPNCDGYYTAASGSGNSFTVIAPPDCPNGAAATSALEVEINPYFVNYIDGNTVSVSSTPGGSVLALTTTGSGTQTIAQRIRSPYWEGNYNNGCMGCIDYASTGGMANIYQLVTFSNGTTPMELRPPYWELHLVTGGSTVSVCPKVENTDLTQTALSCNGSGVGYTLVPDGGLTGVASVDSSGNVSGLSPGWAQVQVSCTSCAAGGVSLPTVTVYVQVHSGSVTFPHFTGAGPIATSFTPGQSHFMRSVWQLPIVYGTNFNGSVPIGWFGPMMQQANLNSAMTGLGPGQGPGTTPQTSCPNWSSGTSQMNYEEAFANTWNIYLENDLTGVWFQNNNASSTLTALAAILNNTEYNRQACLQSLIAHHVSTGRYWRYFNDDEITDELGPFLMPSGIIGGKNWSSAVVSGSTITWNVVNVNTPAPWSQAAGTGAWFQVTGATNSCLNGWYPVTSASATAWTTPNAGSCSNGTYEPSGGTVAESAASLVINPSTLVPNQNISALPAAPGMFQTCWAGASGCTTSGAEVTSIVVSGSTATVNWTGHSIPSGTAIRIWGATSANLNIVAAITASTNSFTFSYAGTTGTTAPASGTYTSSTDPNLFITVDPNWGPNPLLQFYNLVGAVANHPAWSWSILGSFFSSATVNTVYSFEGNPINTSSSFDYIPEPPPAIYGPDGSVWQWMNYSQSSSGLLTRGYQIKPRSMLYSAGEYADKFCRSFQNFNPACDAPVQLYWRPETMVAQMMGQVILNSAALRLYNLAANMDIIFSNTCCGWQSQGTGEGNGINPYIGPYIWHAMAETNALLSLREDTHLQPEANKPYLGPMFMTDAHTSATYGNELMILCGSEMPYGTQTVTLPRISGGSMLKYILTGYSLTVSLLSGNPSTDTSEFCAVPGQTTTYVAQPPGVNVLNNLTFAPPSPLPFGAAKFLVQVGYYPKAMSDDPVTDCTAVCTIAIDHHNTAAWYRVIYADSNSLPLSIGDAVQIPSQGLN